MLPIRGQVDLSRQPWRPTLRQRHTHGTTACPRVAAPAFPRRGQAVLLSPQFCTRSPEHAGGRPGRPRPIPGLPPPGSQREGSLPGGACVCPRKDLVQHNFTTCWHVSINTRLREYLEFQVMQKKKSQPSILCATRRTHRADLEPGFPSKPRGPPWPGKSRRHPRSSQSVRQCVSV